MIDLSQNGYYLIPSSAVSLDAVQFTPANEEPGLDFMQKAVGGYIEVVYLGDKGHMVLNEEGKLDGLAPNHVATQLAYLHGHPTSDYIAGDVLVLSGKAMMT